MNKKKTNKKGFTLIELLGVIVIIGIISTISIVAVSRYFNKSRDQVDTQNKNNVKIAAESYFQANRDLLPKGIGEFATVDLKDLRKANYLTSDVSNSKDESCMSESYVRVVKLDDEHYSYLVNLYCGDETRPDIYENVPKPHLVKFEFQGNAGHGSAFSDVKNAKFSFTIHGSEKDRNIGIYSYQYMISVKEINGGDDSGEFHTVFDSGSIKANSQYEVSVDSEKLSKYIDITGQVRVKVDIAVMNDQGGYLNYSSDGDSNVGANEYEDIQPPICGTISGVAASDDEWTNKATYSSGTTNLGKTRGFPSVITVACEDGEGSGCKRPDFSKSWPTVSKNEIGSVDYQYGARWAYVVLEDNAVNTSKKSKDCSDSKFIVDSTTNEVKSCTGGNKTVCYVRVNVDIYSPTVNVKVYNAKTKEEVTSIKVGDKKEPNTTNPEGTIKSDAYKGAVGVESTKWLNYDNFPDGIELSFDAEDQLYLYHWTWETNDAYLPSSTADNVVSNSNIVTAANATADGTEVTSGYFVKDGLITGTGLVTNPEELRLNERGPVEGSINGLKLTLEGKRYGKLTVYDRAGNSTTIHVYANIDRTPPKTPTMTHTMVGHNNNGNKKEANYNASNQKYLPATKDNYDGTTNWSREEILTSIEGQRIDTSIKRSNETINGDLAGWWKFSFEYQLQDPNNKRITWKNKVDLNPGLDISKDKFVDTYHFEEEGVHRIRVLSCDKALNCSTFSEYDYVQIDYTKPLCALGETYENADGFNKHKWLGLANGGLDSWGNRTSTKQTVKLFHECSESNDVLSSRCNIDSPFNKQNYLFDFNIETKEAGANGYVSTKGTDVVDEGSNMGDVIKSTAGGHVVDYAGNISDDCPIREVNIDYEPPLCSTDISYPQGDPINPSNSGDKTTGWLGFVNGGIQKDNSPTGGTYTNEKKTAVVKNVCTEVPSKSPLLSIESGCDDKTIDEITYDWELNVTNAGAEGVGKGGEIADKAGNRTLCPADKNVNSDYTRTVCTVNIEYSGGYPKNQTDSNPESGWLGLVNNSEYTQRLDDSAKQTARVYQTCQDPYGTCEGRNCISSCFSELKSFTYQEDINTSMAGPEGHDKPSYTEDKAGNVTSCGMTNSNWHIVKADYQRPNCNVVSTFIDRRTSKSGNYGGEFLGKNSSVTIQSFCDVATEPGYGETLSTTREGRGNVHSGCFPDANSRYVYSAEMKINDATSRGRNMLVYVYDRAGNRSAEACEKKSVYIDHTGPKCTTDAVYGDVNKIETDTSARDYSSSSTLTDYRSGGTGAQFGAAGWVNGNYGIRVRSYCSSDEANGEISPGLDSNGSGCVKDPVTCKASTGKAQESCNTYKKESNKAFTKTVGSMSKNGNNSNSTVSTTDEIHHPAYGTDQTRSNYGNTVDRGTYANLINTVLGFNSEENKKNNISTNSSFTDINGSTYAEDIAIAQNNGLTYGTNEERTKYDPNRAITRAEVAAMIVRGSEASKVDLNGQGITNFPDYDSNDSSKWYTEEVNAAIDGGLFNGFPSGDISIEDDASVAQTYALLNRAFRNHPAGYVCTIDDGPYAGQPLESAPYPPNSSASNWYGEDAREAYYSHTCRKENSDIKTDTGEAATVVDEVGNYTTCDKVEIRIDDAKPTCSETYSPTLKRGNGSGSNVEWTNQTTITVGNNCSDQGSQCYTGKSKLNENKDCYSANYKNTKDYKFSSQGSFKSWSMASACGQNGTPTYVFDNVGNKSAACTGVKTIGIDLSKPSCSRGTVTRGADGNWSNSTVTVDYNCGDTGSGCTTSSEQSIKYSYYGPSRTPFSYGPKNVTIYDVAGNSQTCSIPQYTIRFDNTPPTISCSGYGRYSRDGDTISGSGFYVTDSHSQVRYQYMDSSKYMRCGGNSYSITATATDNAGNSSQKVCYTYGPTPQCCASKTYTGSSTCPTQCGGYGGFYSTRYYTSNYNGQSCNENGSYCYRTPACPSR